MFNEPGGLLNEKKLLGKYFYLKPNVTINIDTMIYWLTKFFLNNTRNPASQIETGSMCVFL